MEHKIIKTKKSVLSSIIRWIPVLIGIKPHVSFLENTNPEMLVRHSSSLVLKAFVRNAVVMPYYKEILKKSGVDPRSIKNIKDFTARVPITRKKDIFPVFKVEDLCRDKDLSKMKSAIVSSGTSGVFSYGIISFDDVHNQKVMIDEFLDYYYELHGAKPIIVSALSMGVSFVSSHPVIPTSVRADIALEVIRTFAPYAGKCIVITEPYVAKKIIEDGINLGVDWKKMSISFLLGGAVTSNSFMRYLLSCIAEEGDYYKIGKNSIDGTMGVTEVGLNLFTESADLMQLRNVIQQDKKIMAELFGDQQKFCPALMYHYPTQTYLEIINPDQNGFGEIVFSQLDKDATTPLMRYATGDRGKVLSPKELIRLTQNANYQFKPRLGLPIVAIAGRVGEWVEYENHKVSPSLIKEALYRARSVIPRITGHFTMQHSDNGVVLTVQAKKAEKDLGEISTAIKSEVDALVPELSIKVNCVAYYDFRHGLGLDYEVKWKHIIDHDEHY